MRIVAYAYEADIHCYECAKARFGGENSRMDAATDNEGNPIHPVFGIDEGWQDQTCGSCASPIE